MAAARHHDAKPYAGRVLLMHREGQVRGRFIDPLFGWTGLLQGPFEAVTVTPESMVTPPEVEMVPPTSEVFTPSSSEPAPLTLEAVLSVKPDSVSVAPDDAVMTPSLLPLSISSEPPWTATVPLLVNWTLKLRSAELLPCLRNVPVLLKVTLAPMARLKPAWTSSRPCNSRCNARIRADRRSA